jgi:hypothetical protein
MCVSSPGQLWQTTLVRKDIFVWKEQRHQLPAVDILNSLQTFTPLYLTQREVQQYGAIELHRDKSSFWVHAMQVVGLTLQMITAYRDHRNLPYFGLKDIYFHYQQTRLLLHCVASIAWMIHVWYYQMLMILSVLTIDSITMDSN